MGKAVFKFKAFSLAQDRCAMKIGTDGVLLGAWANLEGRPRHILDIGTGTGLIALMMAQRCSAEQIDALELHPEAYEQAVENFEASDWGDRLFCYHASFEAFVEEFQEELAYDLIISNPPFYSATSHSDQEDRKLARSATSLPFPELLEGAKKLLSPHGRFQLILPFSEEQDFLKKAREFHLFPEWITRVKGSEISPVKRSLLCLTSKEQPPQIDELVLEISRNQYTAAYQALVQPFYLKL